MVEVPFKRFDQLIQGLGYKFEFCFQTNELYQASSSFINSIIKSFRSSLHENVILKLKNNISPSKTISS